MPPPSLRIAFDFVDPGSRLVHALLPDQLVASAEWAPLELAPPHRPALDARTPAWQALHEEFSDEARDAGVPLRPPDFVPRTRKAHELALHAAEAGCLPALLAALFEAHFEAGTDLGRVDALVEVASGVGMDAAECRTVLGVDRFRPEVEATRTALLERGIRGVPTLEWVPADPPAPGEPPPPRLEGFRGAASLRTFLTFPRT